MGTDTNVWPHTCCSCDPALYAGWVDGTPGAAYNSAAGRGQVSVTIAPSGTLFITELYYDIIRSVTGSGLTPVNLAATPAAVVTLPATESRRQTPRSTGTINPERRSGRLLFRMGPHHQLHQLLDDQLSDGEPGRNLHGGVSDADQQLPTESEHDLSLPIGRHQRSGLQRGRRRCLCHLADGFHGDHSSGHQYHGHLGGFRAPRSIPKANRSPSISSGAFPLISAT